MLHRFFDATDFEVRRQIAELDMAVNSPRASTLPAENDVGLPLL
jgi:p-hydroxybenzoate 3-monooxygenase